MPSFSFQGPAAAYLLWNLNGFAIAFLVNSFVEWGAHRWLLHSPALVRFAYELHDRRHHLIFGSDETYHAQSQEAEKHIKFSFRDYLGFLAVTTPLWVVLELALRRPILAGGILATLSGLQLFNSLHWRFHKPGGGWLEGTRFFRYLKEHHRIHHADTSHNLNVSFFPIADFCLGTLKRSLGR